jgi:hypothetical protein
MSWTCHGNIGEKYSLWINMTVGLGLLEEVRLTWHTTMCIVCKAGCTPEALDDVSDACVLSSTL